MSKAQMPEDSQHRLQAQLKLVLSFLERVPRRFSTISSPDDFISSETGIDRMDSICMVLLAAGEEFKKIDRITEGKLFTQYPQVSWRGAMGLRDVLAHTYLQTDPEQLYRICEENIPVVIATLKQMIQDLEETETIQ